MWKWISSFWFMTRIVDALLESWILFQFSYALWAGSTTFCERWKSTPTSKKMEKTPIVKVTKCNSFSIDFSKILHTCWTYFSNTKRIAKKFARYSPQWSCLHYKSYTTVRTNQRKKAAWMIARRTNVFHAHRRELLFYLTMIIYCSPDSSCFFGAYCSANSFIQSGIIIEI